MPLWDDFLLIRFIGLQLKSLVLNDSSGTNNDGDFYSAHLPHKVRAQRALR